MRALSRNVQVVREAILPLSDRMMTVQSDLAAYRRELASGDLLAVKTMVPRSHPFGLVLGLEKDLSAVRDRFPLDPTGARLASGLAKRLKALRRQTDLRSSLEARLKPAISNVLMAAPQARSNEELYEALARAFVAAVDQERREDAKQIQVELGTILERINREFSSMRKEFRQFIVRAEGNARRSEDWSTTLVVVATGAALLISILVVFWINRTVVPIQHLRAGTRRIARGDFALVSVETDDEIGQLAEDFNQMAIRLEERDRQLARQRDELARSERLAMVGKLSSQISHEIRNPLSSMGLNTELLEDELRDLGCVGDQGHTHEALTLTRAIRGEIDRLTNVTSQYLRLARLPHPKLELADLNSLISDLLGFMREELDRNRVTREVTLDPALTPFGFDPSQIRQSVLNLVRNAIEAMSPGGQLRVATVAEPGFARLEIADTGAGISSEALAKLFEPFFTTKPNGTGLGLALVREILHEHGGTITVTSTPEEGTCFTLRLPRRSVDATVSQEE